MARKKTHSQTRIVDRATDFKSCNLTYLRESIDLGYDSDLVQTESWLFLSNEWVMMSGSIFLNPICFRLLFLRSDATLMTHDPSRGCTANDILDLLQPRPIRYFDTSLSTLDISHRQTALQSTLQGEWVSNLFPSPGIPSSPSSSRSWRGPRRNATRNLLHHIEASLGRDRELFKDESHDRCRCRLRL